MLAIASMQILYAEIVAYLFTCWSLLWQVLACIPLWRGVSYTMIAIGIWLLVSIVWGYIQYKLKQARWIRYAAALKAERTASSGLAGSHGTSKMDRSKELDKRKLQQPKE